MVVRSETPPTPPPPSSYLLIDRHLEHFIVFNGFQAEHESPVELLRRVAPVGRLVAIGEVNTAATSRVEHRGVADMTQTDDRQSSAFSST